MPDPPARNPWGLVGTVLCRVVVPAWICTGAVFKLLAANPGLLPRELLRDAAKLGIDLDVLLATLIALEFLAVAVLVFVRPLARPMAIFMTTVFCLVLVREIAAGNASCGCLGANSPSPIVMLVIDAALLLGALVFPTRPIPVVDRARWPVFAAAGLVVVAAATSFLLIVPRPASAVLPAPPAPAPGPDHRLALRVTGNDPPADPTGDRSCRRPTDSSVRSFSSPPSAG